MLPVLFCFVDSVLHVYDLHSLEFKMTLTKSKGTSLFAVDLEVRKLNLKFKYFLMMMHI